MKGRLRPQKRPSSWRQIAIHTWGSPGDPSIYGLLEVDASNALAYVQKLREQTGVHVTLTHLVGKAVAEAIREQPEINAVIRWKRHVYLRRGVDVFFQVAFEGGGNLSGAKVERADEKDVVSIAAELAERAERVREKRDRELRNAHRALSKMPGWLRRYALRALTLLMYDLDVDLRRFGLPYDQFGSVMVTNVGTFGLPVGFGALVPFSRCPIILSIGVVQQRPVAVDGRSEVRPVVVFGATLDHRLLDGYQAGRLAHRFQEVMREPERALGVPPEAGRVRAAQSDIGPAPR